jgi:aryl-alcohol dehydrogenase-like predicted oxidoreductase
MALEFRELGRSGIKISAIGLGTWQWGSREWGWGRLYGKKEVLSAFEKALEVGINFIDTAEVYGRGKSEELIGEAIQGHREDVVLATKVWPLNLSQGGILRAADRSLRRLGVDVIDLYQVHWPNPIIPIRSTMKAMKKLVQAGKVRCVGVSNFNIKRTKAAQEALAPLELASNQVKYNLLDRSVEQQLLPYLQTEKVTLIAYSPLAQGLLTGKYTPQTKPSSLVQKINSRFSPRNLTQLSAILRVLSDLAQAHGKTPSQAALSWLISKQNVVAIPGAKRPENVADNAGAVDLRLTEKEMEMLKKVFAGVRFNRLSGLPNLLSAVTRRG